MNHFSIELSLIALIPALFLCGYVFYKDRVEKEPIGLLALLFGAGAVAYIPSAFIQNLISEFINKFYIDSISVSAQGVISYETLGTEIAHHALTSVLGFSLVQIILKWCVLFLCTHKNKNFNYLFDGIVYSVFVSLGFAIAENIHFVFQTDAEMLLPKLLTSVPCHLFIGVLMGYYYTMWHLRYEANRIENDMLKAKIVEKDNIRSSAKWLIFSLSVPILLNGIYLFAGSFSNEMVTMAFYFIVFIVYTISFIVIDRIADNTLSSMRYLCRLISKGHPNLAAEVVEKIVNDGTNFEETEGAEQ